MVGWLWKKNCFLYLNLKKETDYKKLKFDMSCIFILYIHMHMCATRKTKQNKTKKKKKKFVPNIFSVTGHRQRAKRERWKLKENRTINCHGTFGWRQFRYHFYFFSFLFSSYQRASHFQKFSLFMCNPLIPFRFSHIRMLNKQTNKIIKSKWNRFHDELWIVNIIVTHNSPIKNFKADKKKWNEEHNENSTGYSKRKNKLKLHTIHCPHSRNIYMKWHCVN